jgi:hypothetical protein
VGVLVIVPGAEPTAKRSVSTVSVDEHVVPSSSTPLKHSSNTVCGPGSTLPVSTAPAGLRIVWSASSVMSKPFNPVEFWMKTETLSCVPTVPVIEAGPDEHDEAPAGMMHTVPAEDPCAKEKFPAANRKVPISRKIDIEITAIFFKNYTHTLRLLEKAVRLRLAIVAFVSKPRFTPSYAQSSP